MKPTTCYVADDGTVFLPVAHATDICFFQGHDKAFNACVEHEKEAKRENNVKG